MAYGQEHWLKPGWEQLFEPDSVREQIDVMLHPEMILPFQTSGEDNLNTMNLIFSTYKSAERHEVIHFN